MCSTRRKKLGGNAMQNYTLLLMFPLMVAEKVLDASHDVWQLFVGLQEIVELVIAPTISATQVSPFDCSLPGRKEKAVSYCATSAKASLPAALSITHHAVWPTD